MSREIKTYSLEGLEELCKDANLPRFRSGQLASWLYNKGVTSYDEMTNLPKTMRSQLQAIHPLHTPAICADQQSQDGSRKLLLRYYDDALAEMVILPSSDGRVSVCCSTQSGCAMGCAFCATGNQGLTRSLFPGEIVDQLLIARNLIDTPLTNVVLMGQGEPFANYDNTLAALRIINNSKLLNIGARHISVSTCGLIPEIKRFSCEPEQFTLAISLHAARQQTRDILMPRMTSYPLPRLKTALIDYVSTSTRRVSLEYALIEGINDQEEDLSALLNFCSDLFCHINLIPLNRVENTRYKPSPASTLSYWQTVLEQEGVSTTIRKSRGSDIAGACGQLSNRH